MNDTQKFTFAEMGVLVEKTRAAVALLPEAPVTTEQTRQSAGIALEQWHTPHCDHWRRIDNDRLESRRLEY